MKTRYLCLLFIGSTLFFYSCKKENTTPTTVVKPPVTDSTTTGIDQPLMLQLVNNVRKSGCTCGTTVMPPVNPLTWNDLLAKAALDHSVDMNKNNYFSHTGLDGSTPGDRITLAGYAWNAYGENIAYNYPDEQSVMTAWLQSEGHCMNIMAAGFKEMGAGRDGAYWTQDFGLHK
jgi:uncharacterized protein YkwD